MEIKSFVSENYGQRKEFLVSQKVQCIYYHEYDRDYMQDAYKRSFISKLIDKPFKPVKLGTIVGDAGIHPYWLAGDDRKEQYLLVKFKEYIFPKPIPISCIQDALQAAEGTQRFLKQSEHRIGEKGYDRKSFDRLSEDVSKAFKFVGK